MLLSREDVAKERFNSQNFKPVSGNTEKEQNQFIFYFMQILQFAFELNLINEEVRNNLATILTTTIEKQADGRVARITNFLYIVTLWLQSMTNWDAWIKLSSIKTEKEAVLFLNSATGWYFSRLDKLLESCNQSVTLKEPSFSRALLVLKETVSESKRLNINLKSAHKSLIAVSYIFLREPEALNYLERLEKTVQAFLIEISILQKIDAKSIIRKKHREMEKFEFQKAKRTLDLQNTLENELEALKTKYDQKIQASLDAQKKFSNALNELEKKFIAEHPELQGDELEEAFDDYLDNLPDDFWDTTYEDTAEIDKWYQKTKNKIIQKFEKAEKKLEKVQENIDFSVVSDDYNLETLIKEFALFSLAQKQVIAYPSTLEEKCTILREIPLKMAISEFIKEMKVEFSAEELQYLKAAM